MFRTGHIYTHCIFLFWRLLLVIVGHGIHSLCSSESRHVAVESSGFLHNCFCWGLMFHLLMWHVLKKKKKKTKATLSDRAGVSVINTFLYASVLYPHIPVALLIICLSLCLYKTHFSSHWNTCISCVFDLVQRVYRGPCLAWLFLSLK